MSSTKSTYHSKLYRDFKAIRPDAQREIIRFYDEHEPAIRQMDFEEYFDLLVAYVDALFVVGKYRQHLLMVDIIIENTIKRNIFSYNGQDLFFEMLTCKGISFLHTYEYTKARTIFEQLIRIKPEHEETVRYLEKSIRVKGAPIQHWSRALSIGLLFLATFIIGLEILLIRPFYELYVSYFELGRTALFVLACLILVAGELVHRQVSKKKARLFWGQVRRNKG